MDLRADNRIIDLPDRQKYNISKVKHGFQINRHCNLHRMPKHIISF